MRIISGKNRGQPLAALGKGDDAAHLRPTSDRVRESLFSHLLGGSYGDPVTDARVLDLFAGTGALGLEALSRGAAAACFVDDGAKAQGLLRRNVDLTGNAACATLMRRDARRLGRNDGAPYDLIFLDPPYSRDMGQGALGAAAKGGWIAPEALIVWEEGSDQTAPAGFAIVTLRRYGSTVIHILRPEDRG